MGGQSEKGETGSVEQKSQNHLGKPSNHAFQGKGMSFRCKTHE